VARVCLQRLHDDMLLVQCANVCCHRQSSLPLIILAAALCHAAIPALFTYGTDRITRHQLCHYHLSASHHLNGFEYAASRCWLTAMLLRCVKLTSLRRTH